MVGNAIFKPGMLLFINPVGLGLDPVAKKEETIQGSWASKLGIGGYYVITKVESMIESGKFETILGLTAETPIYAINKKNYAIWEKEAQADASRNSAPAKPKKSLSDSPKKKKGIVENINDVTEAVGEGVVYGLRTTGNAIAQKADAAIASIKGIFGD